MEKLKNLDWLVKVIETQRNNFKIVTTNGCFDILHVGHVRLLEEAKKYGDILIVGVNSNESVRRYKPGRPINDEFDRAEILSSLSCVNYVYIFDEDDPRVFLGKIKPHYHIKSKSGYKGIEKDVVESNGGKIVLLNDVPGYSTTKILEKYGNSR